MIVPGSLCSSTWRNSSIILFHWNSTVKLFEEAKFLKFEFYFHSLFCIEKTPYGIFLSFDKDQAAKYLILNFLERGALKLGNQIIKQIAKQLPNKRL